MMTQLVINLIILQHRRRQQSREEHEDIPGGRTSFRQPERDEGDFRGPRV